MFMPYTNLIGIFAWFKTRFNILMHMSAMPGHNTKPEEMVNDSNDQDAEHTQVVEASSK